VVTRILLDMVREQSLRLLSTAAMARIYGELPPA